MLQSNSRPDRTATKVFDSTFLPSFPPRRYVRGQTGKAASGQFKFQFDDDNGNGGDKVDDDGDGGGGDYDDGIQGIQGGGLWSI